MKLNIFRTPFTVTPNVVEWISRSSKYSLGHVMKPPKFPEIINRFFILTTAYSAGCIIVGQIKD